MMSYFWTLRGDVLKQTNDIQDLIAQGVVGIAFQPNDGVVATAWADAAAAAGIPIVAAAQLIGDPRTRKIDDVYESLDALVNHHEDTMSEAAGHMAAKLLRDASVTDAKIAIIEGAAGYTEVPQRTAGFQVGLKQAGQAFEIVANQPTNWTAEVSEAVCQNILSANPEVDLFFTQYDPMAHGCARAIEAVGSDALVIGIGGDKVTLQAIADGTIDGTMCTKPKLIGQLAFEVLNDVVEGKNMRTEKFVEYEALGITLANLDQCEGDH